MGLYSQRLLMSLPSCKAITFEICIFLGKLPDCNIKLNICGNTGKSVSVVPLIGFTCIPVMFKEDLQNGFQHEI